MGCLQRLVGPEQCSSKGTSIYGKSSGCLNDAQLASRCEQTILCPAPLRAYRSSHLVDSLNKLVCKPKSSPVACGGNPGLEFMRSILSKEELQDDSDSTNWLGFFCGSPPVRTNNPLVHDVQFVRQVSPLAADAAASISLSEGKFSSGGKSFGRNERANTCGATPFGDGKQKPGVRVEGFACGNSKSQSIVPALA